MSRLHGAFTFHEAPGCLGAVEALGMHGETPRHAHERLTVGLVDEGARRFILPDGPVCAGAGDLFVLPPGLPHACAQNDGDDGTCSYRLLCLPPDLLRVEIAAVIPADARLRVDFSRTFRAVASASSDAAEAVGDLLRGLAALLPSSSMAGAENGEVADGPVRTALRFITEHAGEDFVMKDVARAVGVSPFHLHRLFTAQTGLTPREFRETVRLRLARQGLEQGLPPAEAAALAGFYDQSHLYRVFKRHMGCTPGGYAPRVPPRNLGGEKNAPGVDGRSWKG